ncbi:MAG TPA: PP2C family protein-serine/threonine phosphatase [Micromonosporaceae bacterium]
MTKGASFWLDAVAELLVTSPLAQPSGLAALINDVMRPAGVHLTIHLVDREQRGLRTLPEGRRTVQPPVPIDTSLPGRAFMTIQPVAAPGQAHHVWLPLIDGSERLGVLEVSLPPELSADDPALHRGLELLARLIGHLVVAKSSYGDTVRRTRRSQVMSTEGEMLWRMLPPLTFATEQMMLSAALEPCYHVGGDAFDYAVDHDVARIALFDAVGHGLRAAVTSAVTLAATRAARTAGLDLPAIAAAADQALTSQFDDLRFTTAVFADLDLNDGTLTYLNAGHPPPVLMRDGRIVADLNAARRLPLGLTGPATGSATHSLQPGDRLLFYTDGITEARDPEGQLFGLPLLLELAERHAATGLTVPEILRRLSHAVLDHQHGQLQDDATLLLVQWRG